MLNFSYDLLNKEDQDLISYISAFRYPVEFSTILNLFGSGKNDLELRDRLESLKKRGMLFYNEANDRYNLHPVIKRYCYRMLENPDQIHDKYADYYLKSVTLESDKGNEGKDSKLKVVKLEELRETIELYHHLAHSGRFDEVFALEERMGELIDQGTDPAFTAEWLNVLSSVLTNTGQVARARIQMEETVQLARANDLKPTFCKAITYLASWAASEGGKKVQIAASYIEEARLIAERLGEPFLLQSVEFNSQLIILNGILPL